ncbi:MAG: FAD-binding protein [Caldilineaceae bacterium]|nr:FAD-binding protein [Caldilineaceae bacterium]
MQTMTLPTELFDRRQLITNPVELIAYEVDAGFDRGKPDAAFFPQSSADVSRLARWAKQAGMPLIPRGAGTGLAGGAIAEEGGIIIPSSRMNQLLELDVRGRTACVQSGLVNLTLDGLAKAAGLYYPPDPASGRSSVLGGNIGANAGGPHCFKYGVTSNYVMGLTVVLADGEIVSLGGQAYDYPEYDLTALVVGSEGTLGIVTEATLRLIAHPPGVMTMMVSFESEIAAGKAVSAVIAAGLTPAAMELMDQRSMRMIEAFTGAGLPVDAGAALIVEVDGYAAGLGVQMDEIIDLLRANGGDDFRIATTEEERQKIWYGRKSAAGAFSRLSPNYVLTDITVRRSLLGEVVAQVTEVCDRYDVRTANFYHAGDGNLHPLILCDLRDEELMERVHKAGQEIIRICLERDGSISGEHGIGIEKRGYMAQMYSGAELAAMLDIRDIFNPDGILNPGKVFPADIPAPKAQPPVLPPDDVFAPENAEEAAAGLLALAQAGRSVRIGSAARGDRAGAHRWLSTAKLSGVIDFEPDDLFITVGAGTPLVEVQTFLAEYGLQTPLASPWPQASIGGLAAANANAPLRMRYGGLRDNVLCTTVALANGRVIRAGRPLVKNSAGYDLPKLFVGSQGTLGLLCDVTLKLTPLPRARRTLAVPAPTMAAGLVLADAALHHALVASAVLLVEGANVPMLAASPYVFLYTAEGPAEDVEAELALVEQALRRAGAHLIVESDATGLAAWTHFLAASKPDDLLLRMGVPAKALAAYLADIAPGDTLAACIDCACGLIYAKAAPGNGMEAAALTRALRQPALALGGYVVTLSAHRQGDDVIDRWGYRPSSLRLMQQLKQRWDPSGVLNPD